MAIATRQDVQNAAMVALAIAEAIQALGEVPAVHLYARVMDKMSYEVFSRIIDVLVKAGVVKKANHLLTWVGPPVKES